MNKKIKYFISLFFILILLCKGIASLSSVFPSILDDQLRTELLAEGESEQKKGGSKTTESSSGEELFDDHIFICHDSGNLISSKKSLAHPDANLPSVCLDISTPPPNIA